MPPSRHPSRQHNDGPRESLQKPISKFARRQLADNSRSSAIQRDTSLINASPSSSATPQSRQSVSPQEHNLGRQLNTNTSFDQASGQQTSERDRMNIHNGNYSSYSHVTTSSWFGQTPKYSSVPHFDYSWSSVRNGYAHGYPALGGWPLSYNQQVFV
jgi:hypothetical protein